MRNSRTTGLVLAVTLLLLGTAAWGVQRLVSPVNVIPPPAAQPQEKIGKAEPLREANAIGIGLEGASTGQREDEGRALLDLADYWNAHVAFPTGHFDGKWLQDAAAQALRVPVGLPSGQVTYNRLNNPSPLSLDPSRFTALGPAPLRSDGCYSCFNSGINAGRVTHFAIDPTSPNIVYLAADGGGVWKTTNCCSASTTWASTMDDPSLSTLAIDEIAIDPNNHNVLYAATGDFRAGLFIFGSNGILKSTNAGGSWTVLGANVFTPTFELSPTIPSPYRWQYQAVSGIKVDPRNSNNVVAATKSGVFFSYDAGTNWSGPCFTNAFTQTQRQDTTELVLRDTGTSTTVYAAIGYPFATGTGGTTFANGANGVYTATLPASGCPATWQLASTDTNGWPTGTGNGTPAATKPGRIDLTIAPSNSNIIYAEVSDALPAGGTSGALRGVWRTTDAGVTWQQRSSGAALLDCAGAPGTGPAYVQHWYDQQIAVDPNNPDVIYLDGVDIWKSTDGGTTFFDVACVYSGGDQIHSDNHYVQFLPGSSTVLLQANDGGISLTQNADVISPTRPTWIGLNQSLNTIEFYGGDLTGNFATNPQPGANGGSQDNSSEVSVWTNPASVGPQQWQVRIGGDGMFARIEPVFNQRWYQESQNGNLQVSLTGPLGPMQPAAGGWTADTRSFVFPYDIYRGTPNDPANDCNLTTGCTHLIAGSNRVWESVTGGITGSSWYSNSTNLTRGYPGRAYINQVAYAPTLSTTAIVGTMDGYAWFGFGLGQGVPNTATWVNVTTPTVGSALPQRPVMDVALSPANPLVGYVTLLGFDQNTPGFPGHVFQITCTANCATSALVDKTGNLPNIPADSILPNPLFPQQVFVGTDWGLFFTNDINANPPTWQRFQAGLPNVMIWDIEVDRGATTLSVWTRARGAYAWPLPSAPIILPTATPSVTGTPPTATRTAVVTPSATATPGPCFNYTITTGTSTVISGTQDIGNHCDDCATTVQLPFPVTFYDQTFTQGYATSNGTFMFGPATAGGSYNTCLPDRNDTYAIKLYGADLDTRLAGCAACGIFTTTLGTAPNRQFVLQWHAVNFGVPGAPSDFDLIFTEGSSTVSAIYGITSDGGAGEVVGVEQSATTGRFTQYSCNTASLTPGLRIDYHLQSCATPSPTVTATPTSCPVQFVDVPTNNTFYAFIRCLACRGIVGGYPCGGPGEPCPGNYYRPNANVTRGQTAKIVSESAGFADVIPSTQQTFEDVPPGSTFALWVERLATRGIIGGYPCGGPFESCVPPNNRPYFRPGNNVTRGQLSKITSGAAGWTETPTTQTFQDVAPGSTFYVYIERMASRGIISGYPCGGVGEPCIAPANRPYFRPNNSATRGQMSKIAASAFFPNCSTPQRK